MKKRILVALLTLLVGPSVGAIEAGTPRRLITVQGQGKASAIPDIAVVNAQVNLEGKDLDPLMASVRAAMTKIMEAVKSNGVVEKDIQTTLFQVQPKYEYDRRGETRRIGFSATSQISVKVRDLKRTGKLLSAIIEAGATNAYGPQFEHDNPSVIEKSALANATRDARSKAHAIAEAAGVTLGEIVSINPQPVHMPVPVMRGRSMAMEAKMSDAEQPVSVGEQTVTAMVTISFAIK